MRLLTDNPLKLLLEGAHDGFLAGAIVFLEEQLRLPPHLVLAIDVNFNFIVLHSQHIEMELCLNPHLSQLAYYATDFIEHPPE